MKTKNHIARTLIVLSAMFFSNLLLAQNAGDLDPTFGVGGTAVIDVGTGYDPCYGLIIQPDGKIVIGGTAALNGGWYPTLVRMNPDGTLDNTFDGDGITSSDVPHGTYNADANPLALQTDGKLLFTFGTAILGVGGLAVTRFNSDGSIDTSYGTNGTAITTVMEYSNDAFSLVLQADGKAVVVGRGSPAIGLGNQIVAVRYTSNGQLDETFADGGIYLGDVGLGGVIYDVRQATDGKIVMLGNITTSEGSDYVLMRLNENGTLDNSFNEDGIFNFNTEEYEFYKCLTVKEDGSIVAAGGFDALDGTGINIALASVTSTGEFDTTFGTDGVTITAIGNDTDRPEAVMVAPDGKILVVGTHEDFYGYGAVLRYNADGTLDNTFGENGIALIDAYNYKVQNIKLQADGKIVIAGFQYFEGVGDPDYSASRLLYDDADGVNDESIVEDMFSIYPNPTNDVLTLNWKNSTANEQVDISITDINGKIVWQSSGTASFSQKQIETTQIPIGVYSISILGKETNSISRFVISR